MGILQSTKKVINEDEVIIIDRRRKKEIIAIHIIYELEMGVIWRRDPVRSTAGRIADGCYKVVLH